MPKLNDESKIAIGLLAVLAIWTLVAQGPDNSLLVFGQWITKDAITVFNGLLALVTGGLVLVGWRQVRVTKDIADRQVRDTEILQRAYVSVEPGGLNQLVGLEREDKVVVGHVALQNVGHLPARNVSWSIEIKQSATGNLNDFPIDENRFCGNNVIPPGTKAIQGSDKVTLNPGGFIYIWGQVRYEDGFGQRRFTNYCHRYNRHTYRMLDEGGYGIRPIDARFHEYGNDAN